MNHSEEALSSKEKFHMNSSSAIPLEKKPKSFIKLKLQKCNSSRSKSVIDSKSHTLKPPLYKNKTPIRSKSLKRLQAEYETLKRTSPPRPESRLKHRKTIKRDSKNERQLKSSLSEFNQFFRKETRESFPKPVENKKKAKQRPSHLTKKPKFSKTKAMPKRKSLKKDPRLEERSSSRENKDSKKAKKENLKQNFKTIDFENFSLKKKAKPKKQAEKKDRNKLVRGTIDLTRGNFNDIFLTHDTFKTADRIEKTKKKKLKKFKVLAEKIDTQRPQSISSKPRSKVLHSLKKKHLKVRGKNEDINNREKLISLREESAKIIQRWFRKILAERKNKNLISSEPLKSSFGKEEPKKILGSSIKSAFLNILLKNNTQKENESKAKEKNNISLITASSSSFQKKRPKELKIEEINSPAKNPCCSSGDSLSDLKSPQFNLEEIKNSFQSDSLENTLKSLNKPKKSENKAEDYIKNFVYLSDKDSLDSDLDFSSSLINQLEQLTNSKNLISPSSNVQYKIPIQSPSNLINTTEIINKVINTEVNLFLSSVKTVPGQTIDPSADFMKTFLVSVFEEFQEIENEILEIVNVPTHTDPLEKLQILQRSNIGELIKYHEIEELLPQNICGKLQRKFAENQENKKIYVRMLFECVNETMNLIRPFGLKGVPDPWVCHPRFLFGEGELKRIYFRASRYMMKWINIRCGIYRENFEDCDVQDLNKNREERMNSLIRADVDFEEDGWIDYGDEEMQSKGDIADIILFDLFSETIYLLENYNI